MAEVKLRDAYILVGIDDAELVPSKGDKITFIDNQAYHEGLHLGMIDSWEGDIDQVIPNLDKLRADNIVPVNSDWCVFLSADSRYEYMVESGVVVYTLYDLAVVYCGALEIEEDEEERYEITEKGLKYLAEIAAQGISDIIDDLCKEPCQCAPEEREENSTMDNLFGNLGFGKLRGDRFKLSMNGIAVAQNSGKYVVYNKDNNEFVDATNTLFDIKDALFLLPAVEVAVGDTVLHEDKVYFIVDTTNEIKAVSYEDCTQTVLIPKSTMFGIKYFTKVFSMFGDNFAAAGDLFSNPMMLMALMEGKNSDLTQLMLMSSLSNGDLGSNPMALAMMLKGDKGDDTLSTIALMSMFNKGTNPFAPKTKVTNKTVADNK